MDVCTKGESGAPAPLAGAPQLPLLTPTGNPTGPSNSAEEETHVAVDGQQTPSAAMSLHPLKISFYEAVAKQLLDDELHEVAVALCGALRLRANNLLPPDLLFTVFKAAAFQPSQDAAAAAAATAAQNLLLKSGAPLDTNTPGPPGPQLNAEPSPVAPPAATGATATATAAAAAEDAISPMGPSRSGSLAEGSASPQQQHQQQQQQRQWQPLRPRAVPPLTEGEQQLVFNPYTNPKDGGPQGVLPGAPDTRGLEAQVSATVICSTPFKYSCISTACSGDMSFVVGGGLDGSVRLQEVKEQKGTPLGGPLGAPTAAPSGKTRLLLTHEGPVNSVAIGPDSRLCFSGSSDTTVKVFDLSPSKAKASGGLVGRPWPSVYLCSWELNCDRLGSTLRDIFPVTTVSPHPCGDFLYVGTTHPIVRLYDLNTLRAFASLRAPGAPGASAHQRGPLTDIRPSQDGSVLVAASEDGSIHLFDGVTGLLVNKLQDAHKFILSAGFDGQTRIWDVRRGQQLLTFRTGERTDRRATSVFLQNEAFVASVSGSETGGPLTLFSAYTGARVTSFVDPHPVKADRPSGVCALDASPFSFACVTGSADGECRVLEFNAVWPT